jgi:dipeptidase
LYEGKDEDFSFADVYDPMDAESARFCEARVWSFFRQVAAPEEEMDSYLQHVRGFDLQNTMPLYVKVARKLDVNDTLWFMRNKFQDTFFDPTTDVGGGQWHSAERLSHEADTWSVGSSTYANNRPIGVPYTGWGLVANQRPKERYSVLWFGVGDAGFSPRVPFYGAATRVPRAYDDANCTSMDWCRKELGLPGTVTEFSMKNMWWTVRMVTNLVYAQYQQVAPDVEAEVASLEAELQKQVAKMDAKLRTLSDAEAVEAASSFSFDHAEAAHERWLDVYGRIFARHADGYITSADYDVTYPELDETWKEEVAARTGDKYKFPEDGWKTQKRRKSTMNGVMGRSRSKFHPGASAVMV